MMRHNWVLGWNTIYYTTEWEQMSSLFSMRYYQNIKPREFRLSYKSITLKLCLTYGLCRITNVDSAESVV